MHDNITQSIVAWDIVPKSILLLQSENHVSQFLQHSSLRQKIRFHASNFLIEIPEIIISTGLLSMLFESLINCQGIQDIGNYSRLVLTISELDINSIPINYKTFMLFNSFIPYLLLFDDPEKIGLFCQCIVYFVKQETKLKDLIESNLLLNLLSINEDLVVKSLLDIVEFGMKNDRQQLLQYILFNGLRGRLLEYLRVHEVESDVDYLSIKVKKTLHRLIKKYPDLVYQDSLNDRDVALIG